MGAYLSEPMTEKESEDGGGNKLRFGACSMQGWRISQEVMNLLEIIFMIIKRDIGVLLYL